MDFKTICDLTKEEATECLKALGVKSHSEWSCGEIKSCIVEIIKAQEIKSCIVEINKAQDDKGKAKSALYFTKEEATEYLTALGVKPPPEWTILEMQACIPHLLKARCKNGSHENNAVNLSKEEMMEACSKAGVTLTGHEIIEDLATKLLKVDSVFKEIRDTCPMWCARAKEEVDEKGNDAHWRLRAFVEWLHEEEQKQVLNEEPDTGELNENDQDPADSQGVGKGYGMKTEPAASSSRGRKRGHASSSGGRKRGHEKGDGMKMAPAVTEISTSSSASGEMELASDSRQASRPSATEVDEESPPTTALAMKQKDPMKGEQELKEGKIAESSTGGSSYPASGSSADRLEGHAPIARGDSMETILAMSQETLIPEGHHEGADEQDDEDWVLRWNVIPQRESLSDAVPWCSE